MATVRDAERTAERPATISPAQQVAQRPFARQLEEIRAMVAQLKALADRHAAGELPALEDDGSPF
jgi:hypothetical protein